jgi:hypothetical protein
VFSASLSWPGDWALRSGSCPGSRPSASSDHAWRDPEEDLHLAQRLGKHSDGWHYDLLFVVMCLVIATAGGGRYALWGGLPLRPELRRA